MFCNWKCSHLMCEKLCGEMCSREPCDKPCPKKLQCSHPCVGFCGDPCPPLCRICNVDELKEFVLLGFEEDHDARFVLLEDCGHTIEVQGLEGWLNQQTDEIGMKTCPKCRKPIYNNHRYQNIILKTYEIVNAVKNKYYKAQSEIMMKDIEMVLQDPEIADCFGSHVRKLHEKLSIRTSMKHNRHNKQILITEGELGLIQFQAQVLKKATSILKSLSEKRLGSPSSRTLHFDGSHEVANLKIHLKCKLEVVVELIMQKSSIISLQMVDEVSCEMQRLMILPSYWNFQKKFITNSMKVSGKSRQSWKN
nr:NFX1-type zinc finger-containing protein 1-like [Cherax quadricarinatus]